jgi:hypothetical protein
MNDSSPLLAPEVEAILVEMARDPASRLLRVPRAAALPDMSSMRADSLVAAASRAERQLVDAHRDEVAAALTRVAVRMALRSKALAGTLVVLREPDAEDLATTALRLLVSGPLDELQRAALTRAVRHDVETTDAAEPARLVAAALRLAEPRGARAWWPLVALAAGEVHGAWRAALALEEAAREPLWRAIAASNAGLAAWRLGRHPDAADAYGRAYVARPEEPIYLAFHHLNAYLAYRDGIHVELIEREYPHTAPLAPYLSHSLAASPMPALSRFTSRASSTPPALRPVAEVFHGVA